MRAGETHTHFRVDACDLVEQLGKAGSSLALGFVDTCKARCVETKRCLLLLLLLSLIMLLLAAGCILLLLLLLKV
jgi:hypothetical protein